MTEKHKVCFTCKNMYHTRMKHVRGGDPHEITEGEIDIAFEDQRSGYLLRDMLELWLGGEYYEDDLTMPEKAILYIQKLRMECGK